jgi:fucose 4-O-acetylase-like acetyltransferase
MTLQQRILWIDYAKLIGIYFVILGHIKLINSQWDIWIFSFHMPLFFILSGITEKRNDTLLNTVKKGLRTLIIPYFIFYLIYYIWWLIKDLRFNEFYYKDDFVRPILGMLLVDEKSISYAIMLAIPLWFLVALFFVKLLFRIGLLYKKWYISILLLNVGAVLFVFFLKKTGLNIFFSIDSAIMAIPFYTFGFLIGNKPFKIHNHYNIFIKLLISIVFIFVGYTLCHVNGVVNISNFFYGKNLFVFYLNGIVGSIGIIFFSQLFSNIENKLLLYLGANTLIILAFHNIINGIVCRFYAFLSMGVSFPEDKSFTIIEACLISLIVLLLSVIPIFIIRKYFPFIIQGNPSKSRRKQDEKVLYYHKNNCSC